MQLPAPHSQIYLLSGEKETNIFTLLMRIKSDRQEWRSKLDKGDEMKHVPSSFLQDWRRHEGRAHETGHPEADGIKIEQTGVNLGRRG